ncbi:helix-turn-helix domain-containing protein [Pseudoalteromonas sp.]|uniref:helix-turn-helix domain-containing protein n=1 Tax=Pseudoalteromonas sp. TaxID=53249 RepID=UPI003569DEBF
MSLQQERNKISTLIDNRAAFNSEHVQLCVYDTYQACERIPFHAEQLMFCAMHTGKKVMHHHSLQSGQEFLPGQSFIIAGGEQVEIDFPDAHLSAPTSCLTIEVDSQKVQEVAEKMRLEQAFYSEQTATLQLHNNPFTQQLYQRLVDTFSENQHDREVLIDLGISELLVRMLQDRSRQLVLQHCNQLLDHNGLQSAISFINQNLKKPITIEMLCKSAGMSRSKLFLKFKHHLGCTPQTFIVEQKLHAAARKLKQGKAVTQVCYDYGFSELSYFSRRFKQTFGCSPKHYQNRLV